MISLLLISYSMIEETFYREGFIHLDCNKKYDFSLQNNQNDTIYGHIKKFITRSIIFLTIHLLDVSLHCIDEL